MATLTEQFPKFEEALDAPPSQFPKFEEALDTPPARSGNLDALTAQLQAKEAQPFPDQPQGFWNTVRQSVADPALSLAKGVVGLPEAVVGIADIPTGGRVGKALEESIGYDPKFTKEYLSRFYSPEQKAANEEVAKAKGFFRTVQAMGENPSTIVQTVAESVPSMLGGAAIGRGVLAVAPKVGPLIAGAVGEGAISAGQTAEQVRQGSESGLLTPKQAVLSATTGAGTALIGVLGGGLARRLGVADIDTLLTGGRAADLVAKKNILRRVSESALTEGLLEELPQSAQELIQQNYASGRPWNEGVAEASAQGLLAGLVMGGAGGASAGRLRSKQSSLRGRVTVPAEQPAPIVEAPPQVQEVPPTPQVLAPIAGAKVEATTGGGVVSAEAPAPTPITQFLADVESGKVGTTQSAQAFGSTLKTAEEITALKQAYAEANARASEAIKSLQPDATDAQINQVSKVGVRPQFINEAIEAATGASDVKLTDGARYRELMAAGQPKAEVTIIEEPPLPVTKPQTEGPPPPKKPTTISAPPSDVQSQPVPPTTVPTPANTGDSVGAGSSVPLLVEGNQSGTQVYVAFDVTKNPPTSDQLKQALKDAGFDAQVKMYAADETSAIQGARRYEITALKDGRDSTPEAERIYKDFFGLTGYHKAKTALEQNSTLAERLGAVSRIGMRNQGIPVETSVQKYQIQGAGPVAHTIVSRPAQSEVERANNEQPVLVRNDRTGKEFVVLESELKPITPRTGEKAAKADLDQQLTDRQLDPSVFPNAKAKRAAITRHDAMGGKSYRNVADAIADKLEGIKSGKKAGDLHLFGVVSLVWDTAINIAQNVIKAGGSVADAVKAAIDYIRDNSTESWDEPKATEFIGRAVQPQTRFTEPDDNEAEEPSEGFRVNIAGRTYDIPNKVRFTKEEIAAADAETQATFKSLGIPGVPDTTEDKRSGTINNNMVWRIVPDGNNHDEAVRELHKHLIEQIQKQHLPGGSIPYTVSLINAINMNFDSGNLSQIASQAVMEALLNNSVGESSKVGSTLRMFRGISEDMRHIAQTAALRLKWLYADALDTDGFAKGVLKRVVEGIRSHLTENEITNLALKLVKPEDAAPIVAAIRKAVAGDFSSVSDVITAVQAALMDAGMSEQQAKKITSEAQTILGNTIREGANAAIATMKSELTPAAKRGVAGKAISEIQKMLLNDVFNYGDLLTRLAKSERWVVPNAREFEQMREWAKKEEALRTPTADEIAKNGGNADVARSVAEAATIDARKELLRKINTQWSQWTKPLMTRWQDLADPVKVKNTNDAFNEWVAANLLLKVGFGTRQAWDVGWQIALTTPIRATTYAFQQWSSDKSNNRDSNLLHSIGEAISDAYRARFKVLVPALNAFKETLKGKGEQKQVEQLISAIGIFDRALLNASKMRSEGKRGAANLLEIIALTARFGRQFAAAVDVLQGVPAETQEIAHQVRNALREKGLSGQALQIQYDSIMGLLSTYRAESISIAREMLELRGQELTSGAVERAAWHIMREKLYNAAEQAGLAVDDWKKNNKTYRDLIGWNISETGGAKGAGGPGGWVALTGKAAREMLSSVPLIGGVLSVPFTFSNAMGISLNRKLAWSPLGFVPWYGGSPHWQGPTNQLQRKIESVLGTGIGGVLISLIVAGVWKALPAFWPKDEKEREKWVKNGWAPGMVLIPWGNGQELHISTRVGPLSFFSPAIAAAAAYNQKVEDRAKKQLAINESAKKKGIKPEQLPELRAVDWMGIMGSAAYSSFTGGRTAGGAIAAYSDFGTFNPKKAAASIATAITPGLPALNEFGRMAGANINPKLASFWDLLVPMPTSDAQRVNVLGDPMRDENDYRRVFQILSGGNFPFPTSATPDENKAYATLFESEYRPPSINPSRGYNIGGRLRPFTGEELSKYTAARGQAFKRELSTLGISPSTEEVKAAYVRANDSALASVGVNPPQRATTLSRTRSTSRFRGGRRRGLRRLRLGRGRLRSGLRKRRKRRLVL